MKKIGFIPFVLATVLLTGAGCGTVTKNSNVNTAIPAQEITYSGQEGKTAYELLAATHDVEASTEGFVSAIDGIKPTGRQFWSFKVNGQSAAKGAKEVITSDNDTITWQLETY